MPAIAFLAALTIVVAATLALASVSSAAPASRAPAAAPTVETPVADYHETRKKRRKSPPKGSGHGSRSGD